MSATKRPGAAIASIALIPVLAPAVFVLAFLLAFLAMGAADAFAQPPPPPPEAAPPTEAAEPTERPPHGYAQPNEGPEAVERADVSDAEKARLAKEAAGTDVHGNEQGPGGVADQAHAHHAAGHGDPTEHFNFLNFSYRGKDVVGGKFGDGKNEGPHGAVDGEEEPMSAPFILMVVNFLLLMGILAWKGGPVASKLASERHDQIKNALDEAAKLRQQAADKLAEYETRLKDADAEIARLVEGMRKDAETDKARILENAEKQAAQMKRDAEQRIAAEIELARANLTREVTAAATVATEKLLREKMMPGDQANLVSRFITDVQASSAGGSAKEHV
jgi:F-type H+-transporting ATPase subunit b